MGVISQCVTILFLLLLLSLPGCVPGTSTLSISQKDAISGQLKVHFIDVGLGDSTLLQTEGGETILVDVGSASGGHSVARYLRTLGVRKIDHLILTHPHDDHIGGIFSILDQFEVLNFYDNGFSNFGSELYGDYVAAVRQDLAHYHILQAGQIVYSGALTLDVLNPLLPPTGNINEDSIMIKASYGNVSLLLAGDVGQIGERRLLAQGQNMKSQVIKVGHHGENDVMSDEFLTHVNPESAIISVSRINKYGRPHPNLMEKLERTGVILYRTDREGHVVMTTDGTRYTIDVTN